MNTVKVLTRIKASGLTLRSSGDRLVVDSTKPLTEQQRQFIRRHKGAILKALAADSAVSTGPASPAPIESSTAVTAVLPTRTERSEPAPEERLCYQCQHFQRSPHGHPLGLCAEHGLPEGLFSDVRGNRIQHATSHPAQFGCVDFSLREPDTHLCTACRYYHPDSTMCHVVNTGCPYPAIPPCTGAHFEPKEVTA